MKYLAAYLLLNLSGIDSPSSSQIKSLLSSFDNDVDDKEIEFLLGKLNASEKTTQELITEGNERLISIGIADQSTQSNAQDVVVEEKEEEAVEEAEIDVGGGGLFGGDDDGGY